MSDNTELPYEIWATQGQGGMKVAAFSSQKDARWFLKICMAKKDASYTLNMAEKKDSK